MSGTELINRIKSGALPEKPKPTSLDQRVEERLQRMVGVAIVGKIGSWQGQAPIDGRPALIKAFVRRQEEESLEKEKAIEALSPEERSRQAEEALKSLRGSPGFVELHVPVNPDE